MSNLREARSLIEADLGHARNVVELWTRQVSDLEKALEQIEAVGTSRSALQVEYQGAKGTGAVLAAPVAMKDVPRRGRKPKDTIAGTNPDSPPPATDVAAKRSGKLAERSTVHAAKAADSKPARAQKKAAKKTGKRSPAVKYTDPNSDKTWTGHGRPPAWMQGDRNQYEVGAQRKGGASDTANGASAAGGAPSTETA